GVSRSEERARLGGEQRFGGRIHLEGSADKQKAGTFGQLAQGMSAGLQLRHRLHQQAFLGVGKPELRSNKRDEPLVVGLADIMAVQVFELLEVEARRRLADLR